MLDPTSSAETCSPIGSEGIKKKPNTSAPAKRNMKLPPVTKIMRAAAEMSSSPTKNGFRLPVLSDKAGITIDPMIPPTMKTPPIMPASVMLIPNGSSTFSNHVASAVNKPTPIKKAAERSMMSLDRMPRRKAFEEKASLASSSGSGAIFGFDLPTIKKKTAPMSAIAA